MTVHRCGRGGTCEQCGNWEIGCPKPLVLREQTSSNGPYLVCRMKESNNAPERSPP